MIIFVNFAPFTFGGGAERWMLDVSSAVKNLEKVTLVDVHPSIANIYGKLVLKKKFNNRVNVEKNNQREYISLSFRSFVPFRSEWHQARSSFKNARVIYLRYLGGISALKKTVAGIHSPFIYQSPIQFFDYFHNFIYNSFLSRFLLSIMNRIHVINPKDYKLFTEKLALKNVVYVPNYIDMKENFKNEPKKINTQILNIAFVGELTMRKGVDILIETIKKSPRNYIFHIAGDGEMRNDIEILKSQQNVTYHGYLNKQDLTSLYDHCDILFVPSRAESFSLAGLEGMSYGLQIVSSTDTYIGLPPFIQRINQTGEINDYIAIFAHIFEKKKNGELISQKKEIQDYTRKNFFRDTILSQLFNQILEVKVV